MSYVLPVRPVPSLEVEGRDERFPVHRIYCVGRNYAAHAVEMGGQPDREPPFFFTKPADALVANGETIPYPLATENLHHEIELVLAIGKAGVNIPVAEGWDYIFGYAVGNDLTRRDLQAQARDIGRPWDAGKAFDRSAPCTAIHPFDAVGRLENGRIWIKVNDEIRQDGDINELIWKIPEIVSELSKLFELQPGDLIYTGTPAGVGPVVSGDRLEGAIDGLGTLTTQIA